MNITQSIRRALQRLGAILAMTTLAACGGSEEETQCSALIAVATVGFGCLGTVTVSSPPPPVNPPPASPPPPPPQAQPPGSNIVKMAFHAEYEPNNTLDNANPFGFRSATADEHIGMEISGSLEHDTDATDFFIFTPPRSGHFLVYLCADTCVETLHSDEVYLMVYDQSQSTLAGTAVGAFEAQSLGVDLVAGLAYYVEVNGYNANAGPTKKDYKLVIIH